MEATSIKVLLVEDSLLELREMRETLKESNTAKYEYKLFYADSLFSVQRTLKDIGDIDVILLDLNLTDSRGLDTFLEVYRKSPQIPIVILTSGNDETLALQSVQKGAQDYLIKGQVSGRTLTRVLQYSIERKKAEEILKKANEEIKILNKDLAEKNAKLKELDKLKSQFVANVSHEFKNPLAIIGESLALILDGLTGEINKKQQQILETAKKTINRLQRLVKNLLDVSKIEAGKMEMEGEEVDITPLVNEILATYENEFLKKKHTLKKDIPEGIGLLWADRDKISEVIINLLNNAIKYTPAGGNITVKLEGTQDSIRFEISDTGPGIPPEYVEKIFDKFERIKAEKEEGTGLGLPITKDIIGLHKGEIWVKSEVGKGSNFIFTLPRDFRKSDTEKGRVDK